MSVCIKVMLRTFKSKTNFCCSSVVSTSGYNDRSFHFKNFYRSFVVDKTTEVFHFKNFCRSSAVSPSGYNDRSFHLKVLLSFHPVGKTTEVFHVKNFCRVYNDRSFSF